MNVSRTVPERQDASRSLLLRRRGMKSRRRAAETLHESEGRHLEMLEDLHLPSAMLDQSGNFIFCNDFLLRLTGWQRGEIIGRNWNELSVPSGRDNSELFSKQIAERTVPAHHYNEIITKAGERRMISWSNTILYDAVGEPSGVAMIGEDITERIRLENELHQAQKLDCIGRMAGGLAHDLNTLLTVINGYSARTLQGLRQEDPLFMDVQEITKASERAASLTQQLVAFSRKKAIQPRPVDVNAAVSAFGSMLARLIGDNIKLVINLQPALGRVMVDPDQLDQVLMNLIVNARDAMPGGGTVVVRTESIDVDEKAAGMRSDVVPGRYVCLSVCDTGIGMSENVRQKVFEPFFTTKAVGMGTGLGLSTVYGIVRQSHGWVEVESELGRGSSFRIYLPRTDGSIKKADLVPSRRAEALQGEGTVLVVDDHEALRRLTKTILQAHGYQVLLAANGDEAILVASQLVGRLHLLLTDVTMPGLCGQELFRRLRELRPDLKVLLMSGRSEDMGTAEGGVPEPKCAFLPKPFEPNALIAKVRDVLDGSS